MGKLEAGLRPYVDFRSTMQSATYVLSWAAEQVFGAHYLGLVKGGLVLTLCGGAILAWMLRRSFGAFGGVLLAGAITLSGLSPHVFIFYNPLGLLCLAVVLAGLAADPRLWPLRSADRWLICAALVIGGTNKINFHALTVGLAALLILRGWLSGENRLAVTSGSFGQLALWGGVIPLGIELAWTGASPSTWLFNIFELPSERVGFALAGFKTELLWRPPYDVHHSVIFKPLVGVGVALVGIATCVAWRTGVAPLTDVKRRIGTGVLLLVTSAAVIAGSLLLTTTNVEIITLTSLAFPIGAAALVAAYGARNYPERPGFAVNIVPLVSILWTVVGGYAAWQGSRVMFGDEPPARENYVRLAHPSPAVAYLKGVRLEPGWHDSLLATVKEVERIEMKDPQLAGVLFGPAFEWMERAYPAAIVDEMPVWYHHGTSLSSGDGPWLEAKLSAKGVNRIILNQHWESWPGSFWLHLAESFRAVDLGRFARVYERRTSPVIANRVPVEIALRPWSFREQTGSNVHWNTTNAPHGAALFESPWGRFVGCVGGTDWTLLKGAYLAQGNFVVLLQGSTEDPVQVTCQVFALEGESSGVLFEQSVTLTNEQPEVRIPFQVSAGGNPMRLSLSVAPADAHRVLGGWRDLRIGHAGPAETAPPAFLVQLAAVPEQTDTGNHALLRHANPDGADVDGWSAAPFESWQRVTAGAQQASVAVEIQRRPDGNGHPTLLTLAWYKSGRIEFLQQTIVNPGTSETIELSAGLPESGGWVGLVARAADPTALPNIRIRPPQWRF